jgi:hypothetical protein
LLTVEGTTTCIDTSVGSGGPCVTSGDCPTTQVCINTAGCGGVTACAQPCV